MYVLHVFIQDVNYPEILFHICSPWQEGRAAPNISGGPKPLYIGSETLIMIHRNQQNPKIYEPDG